MSTVLSTLYDIEEIVQSKGTSHKQNFDQIKKHTASCTHTHTHSVEVDGCEIFRSDSIKYFGLIMDTCVSLKQHVINKSRVAHLNLHNIRQIRKYLSQKYCQQVIQALVTPHIYYVGALLYGLPMKTIMPLQRIQTMAAKTVLYIKVE